MYWHDSKHTMREVTISALTSTLLERLRHSFSQTPNVQSCEQVCLPGTIHLWCSGIYSLFPFYHVFLHCFELKSILHLNLQFFAFRCAQIQLIKYILVIFSTI